MNTSTRAKGRECLFIGGYADGERIFVLDCVHSFEVLKRPRLTLALATGLNEEEQIVEKELYRRALFADETGRIEVFVVNGERATVHRLIDNYRPGRVIAGRVSIGTAGIIIDCNRDASISLMRDGYFHERAVVVLPANPE